MERAYALQLGMLLVTGNVARLSPAWPAAVDPAVTYRAVRIVALVGMPVHLEQPAWLESAYSLPASRTVTGNRDSCGSNCV